LVPSVVYLNRSQIQVLNNGDFVALKYDLHTKVGWNLFQQKGK